MLRATEKVCLRGPITLRAQVVLRGTPSERGAPGQAMKSATPAIVGTVLGKALAPFDGPGTAVIAVPVNVK